MSWVIFLSIVGIHLVAAMSPGPSFVMSVRTAASDGFGVATALALGFGLGATIWAIAAMAGLAFLFELVPALFTTLKIAGGAFLLFIAAKMWRHADAPLAAPADGATPRSAGSAIRLGLITFAANPKTAVFFAAVFVGLLPPDIPLVWRIAIIGAVFANETLWYIAVARLFSLPRPRAAYTRFKSMIDRLFGGLIGLFGVKIALT
ncbi:LysE family transporter [Yoonia sp. SS1-5]|uniref:LysE family translocator n=1 Tax=Yoonia rhodophyticola TaxID=3137370 RepID=A0AAN0NJT8_9RHOB